MQQTQVNVQHLQRCVENLTREVDQWKHRFEHEQLTSQDLETRLQQLAKKLEFSNKIHDQQLKYYKTRYELVTATLLNLKDKAPYARTAKVPLSELTKQGSELTKQGSELMKQDSELMKQEQDQVCENFRKDNKDSKQQGIEFLANLQHEKILLIDTLIDEQSQATENIQQLSERFQDLQDMLVVKMNEIPSADKTKFLVESEIEAFTIQLQEEEKRLQVPLGTVSSPDFQKNDQSHSKNIREVQETALNNPEPATGSTNLQTLADRRKAEALRHAASNLQLQDSLPIDMAATSVLPTSFVGAEYDCSRSYPYLSDFTNSLYSCEPMSPHNTFCIPEELNFAEKNVVTNIPDFEPGFTTSEVCLPDVILPMTGPRYNYGTLYGQSCSRSAPSPPLSSRAIGPIHTRAKSAPVQTPRTGIENIRVEETYTKENTKNLNTANFEASKKNFSKEEFRYKLMTKLKPTNNLLEQQSCTPVNTDSTGSNFCAIGDLKVLEVDKEGKFVRLLNDGPAERELSGYMIQQTEGGRPVAVFRFPSNTKFLPDSTITIWSAMNDPGVHNPPTDFFAKGQQKWGTEPKFTTLLCLANGEALAWTTTERRFTKDAYLQASGDKQDIMEKEDPEENEKDVRNDEILTEFKTDYIRPTKEPVFLRREKNKPPSIATIKHPHGSNPAGNSHPHTGQARPLSLGNDNSTFSRQSRTQTSRPDPIPGPPSASALAQTLRQTSSKSLSSSQKTNSPAIIDSEAMSNKTASPLGVTCEGPSPFMSTRNKFKTGLEQVRSQHNLHFFPPMPRTSQASW